MILPIDYLHSVRSFDADDVGIDMVCRTWYHRPFRPDEYVLVVVILFCKPCQHYSEAPIGSYVPEDNCSTVLCLLIGSDGEPPRMRYLCTLKVCMASLSLL